MGHTLPLLERVVRERTESTLTPSVTIPKVSPNDNPTPDNDGVKTYMVKRPLGHVCDA